MRTAVEWKLQRILLSISYELAPPLSLCHATELRFLLFTVMRLLWVFHFFLCRDSIIQHVVIWLYVGLFFFFLLQFVWPLKLNIGRLNKSPPWRQTGSLNVMTNVAQQVNWIWHLLWVVQPRLWRCAQPWYGMWCWKTSVCVTECISLLNQCMSSEWSVLRILPLGQQQMHPAAASSFLSARGPFCVKMQLQRSWDTVWI